MADPSEDDLSAAVAARPGAEHQEGTIMGGRDPSDRAEADAEIVRRLAEESFDPAGAVWRALSAVLIEYGYAVFTGWLTGGGIHRAAAAHGGSGVRGLARIPRDLRLEGDDAHDLTVMLLDTSLQRFHLTLQAGRWRPGGGASLCTFFVGRGLMQLPDVYERWHRQRSRWRREVVDVEDVDDGRFSVEPSDSAVASAYLDWLLENEHEHVRLMFELSESGYTMADIADLFTDSGVPYTEAAVRSRINRARIRARERRDGGGRGDDGGR